MDSHLNTLIDAISNRHTSKKLWQLRFQKAVVEKRIIARSLMDPASVLERDFLVLDQLHNQQLADMTYQVYQAHKLQLDRLLSQYTDMTMMDGRTSNDNKH